MESEHGAVKFLGIHFKDDKQRKLVMIASIVGIAAFALYMKDRNKSAGGSGTNSVGGFDPGMGNDGSVSMPGGSSSVGSGDPFQFLSDQITKLGDTISGGTTRTPSSSIKFDYVQDTSSDFTSSGKYSSSKGGGSSFSLGGGGFSLGFGSSSQSSTQREAAFSSTNRDIFSNQSELIGQSEDIISKFLDFSKIIGGTYDQRTAQQKALQSANNQQAQQFIGKNVVGGVEVKEKKTKVINDVAFQPINTTNSATI